MNDNIVSCARGVTLPQTYVCAVRHLCFSLRGAWQANKRTLLFSERARHTEAELSAYKTENMKLHEELGQIKRQWQEWEEWRDKRPAQVPARISGRAVPERTWMGVCLFARR